MPSSFADRRRPLLKEADVAALTNIPLLMAEAWNRCDAEGFAAPFSRTADFIAFEGTHLSGREEIAAFHRQIFATLVRDSRLEVTVRFVRSLRTDVAVVHSAVRVTLAGHEQPSPGRTSMQLFTVLRRAVGWRVEAMENARQLTLERQATLDAYDDLTHEARHSVDTLLTVAG